MSRVIQNILAEHPQKNAIIKRNGKVYVVIYRHGKPFTCALIDVCDIELVKKYTWCIGGGKNGLGYVHTNIRNKDGSHTMMTMQALLIGKKKGYWIDHINRNRYDNRRSNLRHATPGEQMENKKTLTGKGYMYKKSNKSWYAYIGGNGRGIQQKLRGPFRTAKEAKKARAEMVKTVNKVKRTTSRQFI